jgi:phosphatidylglycerophosphate synthase
MESGLKAATHSTVLERRTRGALVFGGACLAALSVSGLAVLPAPGLFSAVVLCSYGLIAGTVLAKIAAFHPHDRFGWPNVATLLRGTVACFFLGLAVDLHWLSGTAGLAGTWGLAALAAAAAALDGIDGWMARRQRLHSPFGARFDMEMDALLILAQAALVVALGKVGIWLLALGLMRYLFVVAGLIYPPLSRPLPESVRRKTVCVAQVVALTLMLVPPVSGIWATGLGAAALVLLVWSFGLDVARLCVRS